MAEQTLRDCLAEAKKFLVTFGIKYRLFVFFFLIFSSMIAVIYFDRIPVRAMGVALNCKKIDAPRALLLNLSNASMLYFRGYEARFLNVSTAEISSSTSSEKFEAHSSLTVDAANQSSSTLFPSIVIHPSADFGMILLSVPAGAELLSSPELIQVLLKEGRANIRFDSSSLYLKNPVRTVLRELGGRPISLDQTLRVDGGGKMVAAYFQSIDVRDGSETLLRATLNPNREESALTATPSANVDSPLSEEIVVQGQDCEAVAYTDQGDATKVSLEAKSANAEVRAQRLVVNSLIDKGSILSLNITASVNSIKLDGNEQLNTYISSFLKRPWYEMGVYGLIAFLVFSFLVAVGNELVKRAVTYVLGK